MSEKILIFATFYKNFIFEAVEMASILGCYLK